MSGGKCFGFAQSLSEGYLVDPSLNDEAEVRGVKVNSACELTLPGHLVDLFNRSANDLYKNEQSRLKMLLIESQDVFAKQD